MFAADKRCVCLHCRTPCCGCARKRLLYAHRFFHAIYENYATEYKHVYIRARVLKPLTVRFYSVGKRRCGSRTSILPVIVIIIIISYHHYQWCRHRRHHRSEMKRMIFQRDADARTAASCRHSTRERLSRLHIRSAFYHTVVGGCHRYSSFVCRQRRQPTPSLPE